MIRRLYSGGNVTEIHSIHDADGNRIDEYDCDSTTQTSTLIREYVWRNGKPIAIILGGLIYMVRTDHIGRSVFTTDPASSTVIWQATFLPFGAV